MLFVPPSLPPGDMSFLKLCLCFHFYIVFEAENFFINAQHNLFVNHGILLTQSKRQRGENYMNLSVYGVYVTEHLVLALI